MPNLRGKIRAKARTMSAKAPNKGVGSNGGTDGKNAPANNNASGVDPDFSSPLSMPSIAATSHGSATTATTFASVSPDESVSMDVPETKFDLPTRRTLFHKLHPWDRKTILKTPEELKVEQLPSSKKKMGPPPNEKSSGSSSANSVTTAHTAKSTPSPHQPLPDAISTRPAPTDELLDSSPLALAAEDLASITSSETTVIPSWNLSQMEGDDDDLTLSVHQRYNYIMMAASDASSTGLEYNVEVPLNQHFLLSPPSSLLSKQIHPLHDRRRFPVRNDGSGLSFEEASATDLERAAIADAIAAANYGSSPTSSETSSSVESANSIVQEERNKENEQGRANHADLKVPADTTTSASSAVHTMVLEDPPEEATNNMCASAASLNQQLADIIQAFGPASVVTPRTKPPRPPSTQDVTELPLSAYESPPPIVQSTPFSGGSGVDSDSNVEDNRSHKNEEWMICRVNALDRECTALKRIVQQDATRILNLQRAVEAQKQLNALKEVEIVDKQTELQISEERIARLKKEREHFFERETELVETIKILKKEVDRMTLPTSSSSLVSPGSPPAFPSTEELDAIKEAAGMAGSQIMEQKSFIHELQTIIREKEDESIGLQAEVDWLKSRQELWEKPQMDPNQNEQPQAETRSIQEVDQGQEMTEGGQLMVESEDSPSLEPNIVGILEVISHEPNSSEQEVSQVSVITLLEDISQRLAALEQDKMEKESELMAELQKNRREMGVMQQLIKTSEPSLQKENPNSTILEVTESPAKIETVQQQVKEQSLDEAYQSSNWCCNFRIIKGEE